MLITWKIHLKYGHMHITIAEINFKKKYASLLKGWGKELKDVVYIKSYLLPATYSMLFFLITS